VSGNCCTNSQCAAANSTNNTCNTSNVCVLNCNAPWVNTNGLFSDGCECLDDTWSNTCGAATGLGTIHRPGLGTTSTSRAGKLPKPGQQDWFVVSFPDSGATSYHPQITISSDNGMVRFDVLVGSCTAGVACGGGDTWWEVQSNGDPNGQTWSPTPAVGTVFIKVYQPTGTVGCGNYTLSVSD
jgi:hypothetical protein